MEPSIVFIPHVSREEIFRTVIDLYEKFGLKSGTGRSDVRVRNSRVLLWRETV